MLAWPPHPQQAPASPRLGAVCQEGRRGLWVRAEWGGKAPASWERRWHERSGQRGRLALPCWRRRCVRFVPGAAGTPSPWNSFLVAGLCCWAWDAFHRLPWGPNVRQPESKASPGDDVPASLWVSPPAAPP